MTIQFSLIEAAGECPAERVKAYAVQTTDPRQCAEAGRRRGSCAEDGADFAPEPCAQAVCGGSVRGAGAHAGRHAR